MGTARLGSPTNLPTPPRPRTDIARLGALLLHNPLAVVNNASIR
jgi:hypothetical protein